MTSGEPGGSPWADPDTATQAGAPYAGPPTTTGPYSPLPYGWPTYGPPTWDVGASRGPRRPGQVVGAAVLSFVQAGLVLCATLYVWLLVSVGRLAALSLDGPINGGPLVAEGTVLTIVQVLSVAALVVAGALALGRRSRLAWAVVVLASVVQVTLAVYWAIRLPAVLSDLPSGAPGGGFAVFTLTFAAGPLVTLGLVLFRPGRTWFDGTRR